MKKTIVLSFAFLSVLAFAADPPTYEISCGVTKQATQGGYKITASVRGEVTGRSSTRFELSDYTVRYTVYTGAGDDVWTSERISSNSLRNDADYNPREYTNHVRFTLPSTRGKVELIYPESLGRTRRFQAHLVFTNINDHFGGTAHVYCTRRLVP